MDLKINNESNDLFDYFMNNGFNWDKNFYKFTRDEKDMCPYTINKKNGSVIIVHNVVGLDKKDLKLSIRTEENKTWGFIIIEGETQDEITGKKYSVNSRLSVDLNSLDLNKVTSTMKNGLLYITIEAKKKTIENKVRNIQID